MERRYPKISGLQKHLIPVYFCFEKGDYSQSGFITAFVIEVLDIWLLITAGHNLEQIEQNIANGYAISACRLVDSLNPDALDRNAVPFEYRQEDTVRLDSIPGMDYGIIAMPELCQLALRKNGIEALNEDTWRLQPDVVDYYMLLGTPDEMTILTNEGVTLGTALQVVEPLDYRPTVFKPTPAPMFYGRVQLQDELWSVRGMSGGPIFSFRQEGEILKCWLHAVQSSWNPGTREIAACLMTPLAFEIEKAVKQALETLSDHS